MKRLLAADRLVLIAGLFAVAVFGPNSQEWIDRAGHRQPLVWHPNLLWASATAAMLLFSVTQLSRVSEFLYFQF